VFRWNNDTTNDVVAADVGLPCYVLDDNVVANVAGTAGVIAGIVERMDSDGVWVRTLDLAEAIYNAAIETVTTGAISVLTRTSLISVTGTVAYTLADGLFEGQRKTLRCSVAASTPNGTITPVTLAVGSTLDIDAVDEGFELEWHALAGWEVAAANDTAAIQDDAVDSQHIAAGALDPEHFAALSVETAAINDLAVTTGKIALDAIDGTLIEDNAVDSEHIAAGAIDPEHFAADSVETAAIDDLAVTTGKIAAAAVTGEKALVFVSAETAGTGSEQDVAHGLGAVPLFVLIVPTEFADTVAVDIAEGTHDGTNLKITTAAAVKFKAMAWA